MNKKGSIKVVVSFAILGILLAIVLVVFFGPKELYAKAGEGADWISDKVLSGLGKGEFQKPALEVDKDVEETYNNILGVLRTKGDGPCIARYDTFADDFKDNAILITAADGIFVRIVDKNGQFPKKNTVSGKVPCVVGEGSYKNFYDNYLDGSVCTDNCKKDYSIVDMEFKDKNHVNVQGQERELKNNNLVYKTKDGNVCFLPTYGDFEWPWQSGECKAEREEGIDDDCFDEIEANIKKCDETIYAPYFYKGTFYGERRDWRLIDEGVGGAHYYYTGIDPRVPFKYRIEAKDVSLGSKGASITEFENAFSSWQGKVPGKMGVYYEGTYYGVKEDWEYKVESLPESIWRCNRCWVYTGDDEDVPEKFRTDGIALEKKARLFGPPREE